MLGNMVGVEFDKGSKVAPDGGLKFVGVCWRILWWWCGRHGMRTWQGAYMCLDLTGVK